MIPKSFTLVNRKWVVRYVTQKQLQAHLDKHWNVDAEATEKMSAEGVKGLCDPDARRIFINKTAHTDAEDMAHTYWHEFTHALLYANGESGHDEVWVDRIGGFMHQVIDSSEYHQEPT